MYLITLFLCKAPEAAYQYQGLILLSVTDNLLFLNQRKGKTFSMKECAGREGQTRDRGLRIRHITNRATVFS